MPLNHLRICEETKMRDVFFPTLTKYIKLPIHNEGPEDIYLKKGEQLGIVYVERDIDTGKRDEKNVKQSAAKLEQATVDFTDVFSHLNENDKKEASNILKDYEMQLQEEAKQALIEHEIKLKDSDPVSIPARRLPYSQRKEIDQQVQELLEKNIIEPSRSPYASPVIPVKKKDGSLRMCVDYHALKGEVRSKMQFGYIAVNITEGFVVNCFCPYLSFYSVIPRKLSPKMVSR